MTSSEHAQAAIALTGWFESQDIGVADAVAIMAQSQAAILVAAVEKNRREKVTRALADLVRETIREYEAA
jgi:hypothetical protein